MGPASRCGAGGRGGPGPGTRGCSRGGSRALAGPPPPASPGHSPPRRWPPPSAPRPPSCPAPPDSPGLGAVTGGRGGTRRARRLGARAGKRGAAESSGRPAVWASGAPVSQSPRGAPRSGVGRAGGIRTPRRPGGAARTVWCPRRGGGRSACEGPVTRGGNWGLGLRPRTLTKVRSRRPVGAGAPAPRVPGDGAGPPRGAAGGEAPRSARLESELLESPALPSLKQPVAFYPSQCCLRTSLKVTFSFLFSLVFS